MLLGHVILVVSGDKREINLFLSRFSSTPCVDPRTSSPGYSYSSHFYTLSTVRRSSWTRRDTRSSSRPKRSPASSSPTWRSRTPSLSTTSSSPLGKLQSRKEKKMNGNFRSKGGVRLKTFSIQMEVDQGFNSKWKFPFKGVGGTQDIFHSSGEDQGTEWKFPLIFHLFYSDGFP